MTQNVIVKTYKGSQSTATAEFQKDAAAMAKMGYFPTTQNYAQGTYGCGAFILALLLCIIIIGILVFIYMLIVKPDGTLSVTYELKPTNQEQKSIFNQSEKQCPKCAEAVKQEAKICRFCGHNFEQLDN
jgi:hypothetical protein